MTLEELTKLNGGISAPNKHARFETRYTADVVSGVRILLRQHIGLDPMPSYRSIARQIENVYPVKISGTTVKRMLAKLCKDAAPGLPEVVQSYSAVDVLPFQPTLDVTC